MEINKQRREEGVKKGSGGERRSGLKTGESKEKSEKKRRMKRGQ